MLVSPPFFRKEVDIDENKNFYYKVFKTHCYHFTTFYLTGVNDKKTDTPLY